jgi:antitoxin CptB
MSARRPGLAVDRQRSRLSWRCRRGMKELDLLLLAWLESAFDGAGAEQQARFAALLELPDPQLARYLTGAERPEDAGLAALIEAIAGIMSAKAAGSAGGSGTFAPPRGQRAVPVSAARRPRQLP